MPTVAGDVNGLMTMSKSKLESMTCKRCRSQWLSPVSLDEATRQRLANLIRLNPVQAIQALREQIELELVDAKAIVFHVTKVRGQCHRCSTPLDGGETTVCRNCQSLNYDW